jgi:hypothetical protein
MVRPGETPGSTRPIDAVPVQWLRTDMGPAEGPDQLVRRQERRQPAPLLVAQATGDRGRRCAAGSGCCIRWRAGSGLERATWCPLQTYSRLRPRLVIRTSTDYKIRCITRD